MKFKSLCTILFTCAFAMANAQVSFQLSLGGGGRDEAVKIVEDDAGNLIIIGTSESTDDPITDCYVAKINPSGTVVWEKTYGYKNIGSFDELLDGIIVEDNYYVVGDGINDISQVAPRSSKLNADGTLIYDSTYYLKPVERATLHSVCYNEKDKVFLAMGPGFAKANDFDESMYFQRFDATGKIINYRFLKSVQYSTLGMGRIFWDKSRNGYMSFHTDGVAYIVMMPMDSAGSSMGIKAPYVSSHGYITRYRDVIQLQNGNYVVLAELSVDTSIFPARGCFAMQYTSMGDSVSTNRLTDRDLTEDTNSLFTCIAQCLDGGFILGGSKLRRTDSLFHIIWEKTLNYSVTLKSVIQTKDGGYAGCGTIGGNMYVIKTDSVGFVTSTKEINPLESQIQMYPNPANDYLQINAYEDGKYLVDVMELSGRKIISSVFKEHLVLDIRDIVSGVYFIRLTEKESNRAVIKKCIIAR